MEKMIDKFVIIKPTPESSKKTYSTRNLPNSSCLACRTRKVKCDSQKPSCSNCVRRNQECTYITEKYKRKALSTKREIKKFDSLESTPKTVQKEHSHYIRYRIQRIETELLTYKYLAKHWYNMSLHINNSLGISTDQNLLSWIEVDKNLELDESTSSIFDKDTMMKCIKLFEKKLHLIHPFIKLSWDSNLAYEFWQLLVSDINFKHSYKSDMDIFILNNNIYHLTKLLYYTIIYLYGSYHLKNKVLENHLLNHTKNLIKAILFEKNASKYSYCANDIVLSLCWLSMYLIQNNNFVAVSSYLLLAYQFVMKHKRDIEPYVIDLYYIFMRYASIKEAGEFPLTNLLDFLSIQPGNSNYVMFCVDGLSIISKLKDSDEISSSTLKEFLKRMENGEKALDEWNKYQGLSIFSLNNRIVLLALRAELAYRLGMIEESDKWIDHLVDFVLGTKINLLLRLLDENLVFFKLFSKNYVYNKIFQRLEEKQYTQISYRQENFASNSNDAKHFSDQQNIELNIKSPLEDHVNYYNIQYEH